MKNLLKTLCLAIAIAAMTNAARAQVNIFSKLYLSARNVTVGAENWTFTNATADNAATDYWKMVANTSEVISSEINFSNYSAITVKVKTGTFGAFNISKSNTTVLVYNGTTWVTAGTTNHSAANTSGAEFSFDLISFSSSANSKIKIASLNADGSIGVRLFSVEVTGTSSTPSSPSLTISPASLAFGSVKEDENKVMDLDLTPSALTSNLSLVLKKGASSVFTIDSTVIAQSTAVKRTLKVSFTPASVGEFKDTLVISGGGLAQDTLVALSGAGISASTPTLSVSPKSLSFGNQKVSVTSAARKITIDTAYFGANNYTYSIEPTGQYAINKDVDTLQITFTPTATGTHSAKLYVECNNLSLKDSVTLSGTGVVPTVAVDSAQVCAGKVEQGASKTITLKVSASNLEGNVTLALSGTNATMFSIDSSAFVKPANGTLTNKALKLTYTPTAIGAHTATLTISSTGVTDISINLSGEGIAAYDLLLEESFNYNVGDLPAGVGQKWVTVNSGALVQVSAGALTYPDYIASGIDKKANIAKEGMDYSAALPAQTSSGSVYAAMMINVSAANATGDYPIHFISTGTAYSARVYFKSTTEGFQIGINKSSTAANAVYATSIYNLNTTYLLVVKYEFIDGGAQDDKVSIYVNPTINSEPATASALSTEAVNDLPYIGAFALRQGTAANAPTLAVGGIRVARTWAEAVKVAPCNTPTALVISNITSLAAECAITGTSGKYQLQYALKSSTDSTLVTVYNTPDTTLRSLVADTVYGIRVRGVCASGKSAWSAMQTFRTLSASAPVLTASPSSIAFGKTCVADTSAAHTVTIGGKNLTGNITYSLKEGTSSKYIVTVGTFAADTGGTLNIKFAPIAVGEVKDTLIVVCGGLTDKVALSGTGIVQSISIAPAATYNFGKKAIGSSDTKKFTISTTDLCSDIVINHHGAGFTVDKTSIAKSATSTELTVTFTPTAAQNYTAIIQIDTLQLNVLGAGSDGITLPFQSDFSALAGESAANNSIMPSITEETMPAGFLFASSQRMYAAGQKMKFGTSTAIGTLPTEVIKIADGVPQIEVKFKALAWAGASVKTAKVVVKYGTQVDTVIVAGKAAFPVAATDLVEYTCVFDAIATPTSVVIETYYNVAIGASNECRIFLDDVRIAATSGSSSIRMSDVEVDGYTADKLNDTTFVAKMPTGTVLGAFAVGFELSAGAIANFVSGSSHNFINGNLVVTATKNGESRQFTIKVQIGGVLAVDKQLLAQTVLYPNPAETILNISAPLAIEKIEIINMQGSLLLVSQSTWVNVSSLSSGTYIVRITFANGKQVSKTIQKK